MSVFLFNGPEEILRKEQKEEELCQRISRQLCEVIDGKKKRTFIKTNKQYILRTSQILYYGLTSLYNLQMLDEDPTKNVKVGKTAKHVPGRLSSVGMIFAHVFGDQIIVLALDRFINFVRNNQSIAVSVKNQIIHIAAITKSLIPLLQSLNKVLFYGNGSIYMWAKRIFSLRHIFSTPWYHYKRPINIFKILSILNSVQMTILLLMHLSKNKDVPLLNTVDELYDTPMSFSSNECSLCLHPRLNPCVAVCGHLFCWYCIHEWLQTKNFCPICNEKLNPRKIIPLQNLKI